jgi:hypothetical protein
MRAHLHTADVMREENKSKIPSLTRIFFPETMKLGFLGIATPSRTHFSNICCSASCQHVRREPVNGFVSREKAKNISDSTVSY